MSAGRMLVAIGTAAAVLGAAGVALARRAGARLGGLVSGPVNARRARVLAFLDEVVPSRYPDPKFMRIVGERYDPKDPALPPGFTTCGALPCAVGQMLGVTKPYCITQGGLEQMRKNGRAIGAWIEPNGKNRPEPGDLYGIDQNQPGAGANLIVHVGVFVRRYIDASGREIWVTADTGQGSRDFQEARYVERPYDPKTNTLGGPAGPRPVAGWYNIDKAGATP